LGWFCGTDDSKSGGPSRTAMSRNHCADDYTAVNELGKAIGMKINCGFVLSEWDPDNRLRKIPHLSKFGSEWNNAAYIDKNEIKKCVEVINNSPYIDFSVHALSHGYYANNVDFTDVSDWYTYVNNELIMVNESEIRDRLNAFFDLVSYNGINKKIDSFVPPSGAYRVNEISAILKEYGIKYVTNPFDCTECLPCPISCVEETGIILSNRNRSVPWNIIGADTKKLPVDGITMVEGKPSYGVFGLHWPNVLHINPEKNMEVVASWTEYIKNCSEQFSTFISPDLAFTSNQLLYLNFADVQVIDNRIIIDVSKVPSNDEFCVNIKECIFKYFGCVISKFSAHTDFTTYKIKPTNPIIELVIK